MKIYLLRHGATDWADEGRTQGHTDIPLNARGREQIAQAGDFFARIDEQIDLIISSPLIRALQSAEIVAEKIGYSKDRIPIEPAFIERCFGFMEGSTAVERTYLTDKEKAEKIMKKGNPEPVEELCIRGGKALRKYVEAYMGKTLLIVAHSSIIKATLTSATDGKEPYKPGASAFGTGEFCLLSYEAGVFAIKKVFDRGEIK